jgi:hypothetical protein
VTRDDVGEARRRHGRRGLHAKLTQAQAQAVLHRQILPAVSLANRPGRERPLVPDLKVELRTGRPLDQRPLGAGWPAADMRDQLGPSPPPAAELRASAGRSSPAYVAESAGLSWLQPRRDADAKPPQPQAFTWLCVRYALSVIAVARDRAPARRGSIRHRTLLGSLAGFSRLA